MEKYSQSVGDYWSYSISGCVHKLQEWKSRHLSGAKLVAPVVSVGEPELLRDTLSSDMWFTDVQVPYVLLPHALPVGQAGLFSQPAGHWHQPIAQLPSHPAQSSGRKTFQLELGSLKSPEMIHPSWEGFPDPTVQQRKQGCCREQTWGRQSQFTYAIQLSTVITDVVCSMLVYLLLYITRCIIACRNPFCP